MPPAPVYIQKWRAKIVPSKSRDRPPDDFDEGRRDKCCGSRYAWDQNHPSS